MAGPERPAAVSYSGLLSAVFRQGLAPARRSRLSTGRTAPPGHPRCKARALHILRSRLYDAEQRRLREERAEERRGQIGTGERSERIRTYNFPQNRVTDHRLNLTLHRLERILEGDLDELVERAAVELQEGIP